MPSTVVISKWRPNNRAPRHLHAARARRETPSGGRCEPERHHEPLPARERGSRTQPLVRLRAGFRPGPAPRGPGARGQAHLTGQRDRSDRRPRCAGHPSARHGPHVDARAAAAFDSDHRPPRARPRHALGPDPAGPGPRSERRRGRHPLVTDVERSGGPAGSTPGTPRTPDAHAATTTATLPRHQRLRRWAPQTARSPQRSPTSTSSLPRAARTPAAPTARRRAMRRRGREPAAVSRRCA